MHETRTNHEYWMREAITLARLALPSDVPVGALVLFEGKLVASGYNRREIDGNPVGHAEILALQAAAQTLGRWRLTETTLYVTLEPCPMCASAIQQSRVGQVVFGAFDPVMGACGSSLNLLPTTPELPVLGGILEEPCSRLLKDFFQAKRF